MITLQEFCTCTQTYKRHSEDIDPYPWQPESFEAIQALMSNIIEPIISEFGRPRFQLTYGFCSLDLKRFLEKGRNQTCCKIDQHCALELNQRGKLICDRKGAAADFRIEGMESHELAAWIQRARIPFDSLYFYGAHRPIHISYGPQHKRAIWDMQSGCPRRFHL